MEDEKLSRRGFLAGAGKIAAAAGIGAMGLTSVASAQSTPATGTPAWPWPYKKLNLDEVDKLGQELYKKFGCGQGSFEALIAAEGAPYTSVPTGMLRFGGGGIAGWGSHCGAILGSSAFIALVNKDPAIANKLITELTGWYTEFHGAGSPLCHVSVTEWSKANGVRTDSQERKDRCAMLTGACARKAAELLNAEADGAFAAGFGPRWEVVSCHSCHGENGLGQVEKGVLQDCTPCHEAAHKS